MKKKEQLKELLRLTKDDLQKTLKEKQEDLRQFRFDLSGGKVKDVRAIRQTKRNVARIQTLLNRK